MDTMQELLWGTFRDLEATRRIPHSSAYAHLRTATFDRNVLVAAD